MDQTEPSQLNLLYNICKLGASRLRSFMLMNIKYDDILQSCFTDILDITFHS